MLIILTKEATKDTTADLLVKNALFEANKYFDGNLKFKRFEFSGPSGLRLNVTLTVNDSKEIGSRRNAEGGRIAAACWHAHGVFFDSLPAGTEIRSAQGGTFHAGDKWQDSNIGSLYRPLQASHACNCMDWNVSGVLPFPVNV
jgi:hypothetical protein